jgi:hypothetical protein
MLTIRPLMQFFVRRVVCVVWTVTLVTISVYSVGGMLEEWFVLCRSLPW